MQARPSCWSVFDFPALVWEAKAAGCRSARPSRALSITTGCPAPPRLPGCHSLSGDISSWKMPWWLLLTLSLPMLLQCLSTQRGQGDTSQAPAPSVISACEWPGRWASWSVVPGASTAAASWVSGCRCVRGLEVSALPWQPAPSCPFGQHWAEEFRKREIWPFCLKPRKPACL